MSSARGIKRNEEVREILRRVISPTNYLQTRKEMIGVYKKPKQENIINTNLNIFEPTKDIKFDPPIRNLQLSESL